MIATWFTFFVSMVGDIIDFLDGFKVIGNISLLQIIVVSLVALILTGTFLSVARR